MAASASATERHSTSTFVEKPPVDRAAFTAAGMAASVEDEGSLALFWLSWLFAQAHMWLSFSMVIELRSWRCGSAPPIRIPYFSTRRNPGVVLRVPAKVPFQE